MARKILSVLLITILTSTLNAESDDLASFSGPFFQENEKNSNGKEENISEEDSKRLARNIPIDSIKLKVDKKGRKRTPNLFLFKKVPLCDSESNDICRQDSRDSKFMLVDTIYREEKEITEEPVTVEHKVHARRIYSEDFLEKNIASKSKRFNLS